MGGEDPREQNARGRQPEDVSVSTVSLPIVRVTVLEDRALVERRGQVRLAAGVQRLRVEGLSPLAVDRSLQAQLGAGRLVGARLQRAWKEQPRPEALEQRSALAKRVEVLEQQEAPRLAAEVARLEARQGLVQAAREDVLRALAEQAGAGQAALQAWREQLGQVRAEQERVEEALRKARREQQQALLRLEEARRTQLHGEQPEPRLDTWAELEVEHPEGGEASLRLSYLVPCAVWRPAYRAVLGRGEQGERVELECEAVVWQRTQEDWSQVELCFSTARPTLGVTPPRLTEDWLRLRDKTEREKRVVEVSMREEAIQTTGEGGARPVEEMPGLDDGGEPLLLKAEHRASVPADGAAHRVALFRFQAPASSELVCYPELSELVYRVARFENKGPAVLLAGPVDLVRAGTYMGRSQLAFAAQGERVRLGFGSEDLLRVARTTEEKLDTRMLTGRRTRTHQVKLFLSNTGPRPERVAVEERMPVSEVESVEVELVKDKTRPAPNKVSQDGIVRFELQVPPRSQQELLLTYTVSSASNVAGL